MTVTCIAAVIVAFVGGMAVAVVALGCVSMNKRGTRRQR